MFYNKDVLVGLDLHEIDATINGGNPLTADYFDNITWEELFDKLKNMYEDQEKFIKLKREKLIEYFESKIGTDGEIVVETATHFWHCRK